MFYIGCHLSFTKGYKGLIQQAEFTGSSTFQFFTRSPRGGKAKPFDVEDAKLLIEKINNGSLGHILAHAPYTLNACSDKEYTRTYAEEVMRDDLFRMSHFKGSLYNFHPGSHVGQGVEAGTVMIVDMLNRILSPDQETIVLLETMAGKGSEIGRTFEELKAIIDGVEVKEKLGVCWDTCHLYDAGYDLVNDLDGVIEKFDEVIGLDKLYAIHINDSKNPFNSHKDRHEKIGQGSLGVEAFERIINHPKLRHLPFYLETPQEEDEGYRQEIELLKELRK